MLLLEFKGKYRDQFIEPAIGVIVRSVPPVSIRTKSEVFVLLKLVIVNDSVVLTVDGFVTPFTVNYI